MYLFTRTEPQDFFDSTSLETSWQEKPSIKDDPIDFMPVSKVFKVPKEFFRFDSKEKGEKLILKQFKHVGMSPKDLYLFFRGSKITPLAIYNRIYLPILIQSLPSGTIALENDEYNYCFSNNYNVGACNAGICNIVPKLKLVDQVTVEIEASDLKIQKMADLVNLIKSFAIKCDCIEVKKKYEIKHDNKKISFKVNYVNSKFGNFIKIDENTKLKLRSINPKNILIEDKVLEGNLQISVSQMHLGASPIKVSKNAMQKAVKEFLLEKILNIGERLLFNYQSWECHLELKCAMTANKNYGEHYSEKLIKFHFSENTSLTLDPHSTILIEEDEPEVNSGQLVEERLKELTFVGDPINPVEVQSEPVKKKIALISFSEFAAKQGIVNVPEELEDAIKSIVIFYGELKNEAIERNIIPPAGILLYGPPGNGKSTFAKLVTDYLCQINLIDSGHIASSSATILLKSKIGETEESIRNLFAKAKADAVRLREKSPLYITILDEVEGVTQDRSKALYNWEVTMVDAFLGEFGNLSDSRNHILIAMANSKERIDPAILRPGRLGSGIYVGVPNEPQRHKLLETLFKKYAKSLSSNVDSEALAGASDGLSAASITSIFQTANNNAFNRVCDLYYRDLIAKEEFSSHPDSKITMLDLVNLFESERSKQGLVILDYLKELIAIEKQKYLQELKKQQAIEIKQSETQNSMYS